MTQRKQINVLTEELNEPMGAFRQKTALDLVREGRTEAVVTYLESISAGFVG